MSEPRCPRCGREMIVVRLFAQESYECPQATINILLAGEADCSRDLLQEGLARKAGGK